MNVETSSQITTKKMFSKLKMKIRKQESESPDSSNLLMEFHSLFDHKSSGSPFIRKDFKKNIKCKFYDIQQFRLLTPNQ